MSNKQNSSKVLQLTQLGILAAIMIILHITGIGYIKIGVIEITIMMIPVVIGAIVCGPASGGILGGIFGITSFVQCFGTSAFGTFLFGLNPIATFILCMIPRILVGILSGYIFKALIKADKTKVISFGVTTLSGALFNTILFLGFLVLFFWKNDAFLLQMNTWGLSTDNIWGFLLALVGTNGLIEAVVCFIVGAAVSKALVAFIPGNADVYNKNANQPKKAF